MVKSLQVPVVLSMLLAAACSAAEPSVCKSICAEEKRVCRAEARRQTDADNDKPFALQEAHRDARVSSRFQGTPQEAKAVVDSDYRKRKQERDQACDSKAMACSRACSAPAAKAAPDSILVQPKTP